MEDVTILNLERILEMMKFKTGRITFPGLSIRATLKPNQYFLNEGPVEDVQKNYEGWAEIFKLESDRSYDTENLLGEFLSWELISGHQLTIMYYLEEQEHTTNTIGHESTHALIGLGLGYKLTKELEKEGFDFDPFEFFDDEEDIADVGGILAVYKKEKNNFKDFNYFMEFRYFAMAHMEKDDIAVEEGLFDENYFIS